MIDIRKIQEDGVDILSVVGEVDASSSIVLDQAIADEIVEGKNFLIDCTALEYISSAGLGVFMSYIEDFKAKNISVILFGLNQKVRNVFEILGLDQLIIIRENKGKAIATLNGL